MPSGTRKDVYADENRNDSQCHFMHYFFTFPSLPSFFPVLSLAIFFARAPPSKRLEQGESELNFQ